MWSQQDMSINSSHDWLPANDLSWLIRLPTSQDLISFLGCMQEILKVIVCLGIYYLHTFLSSILESWMFWNLTEFIWVNNNNIWNNHLNEKSFLISN